MAESTSSKTPQIENGTQEPPEAPEDTKFSLENILGDNHDAELDASSTAAEGWDEETVDRPTTEGYCVECEDQPAQIRCDDCQDDYCEVCFAAQHRKGTRRKHITKPLAVHLPRKPPSEQNGDSTEARDGEKTDEDDDVDMADESDIELERIDTGLQTSRAKNALVGEWFVERSKYIPLRLSLGERKYLRLLDAAFILPDIFELGRRHKIMNPDKMRTTYGKLIYLLQDSQSPEVKDMLNFTCVKPIKTVYSVLEERGATGLLRDDLITLATMEIYSDGRTRREVQKDIKAKERHRNALRSQEKVRQCIYSIGDNHAFLRTNRDPCDRMIAYLKQYFHPTQAKNTKHSLAIRSGKGGARLSHDHAKQYAYVLQSLTLWREILHDMFRLWSLTEQDLLSETVSYRLRDTGQGLNRVQAAPKTLRMMHTILHRAQQSVGSWVGSSAIHMGDHNVPNALMFIDKYSQIYRILLPICNTLRHIPIIAEKPALRSYIDDEFGSEEGCILEILTDFFRHGFDGSGADNFFDAGSCIDGRLTSAWNWCAQLEKKRYFPVFLLTGFVGFDGEW
ncbi:hypothetical protein BKA82DRAFT_4328340 [Pisolithus tinctorius]|nr:hypothetical protein BKA82DRAFT_4328340 [Pisolithus tinctorius]